MLVIYGPTATGKTDLALKLARKFNGELISADSRQVYKGLDIGTGKVSFSSKIEKHKGFWIVDGVKISGFDLVEPGQQFSAADFLKFAHSSIVQTIKLKKLPIVVGGTGFYIKAFIYGIGSIGIPQDKNIRRQLEKLSTEELFEKLKNLDSQKANSLNASDSKNPRRLIRSIEIATYNQKQETKNFKLKYTRYNVPALPTGRQNTKYLLIGLTAPNQYLYDLADKWLKMRLDHGLIDEVKNLVYSKIDPDWLENLGLEYRWIARFVLGKISKDEATIRLEGDIHGFIRRQKTWFRQFKEVKLYDITNEGYQSEIENEVAL